MKVKTSLSLSPDLLATLDELAGPDVSRSAFIEHILRDYVYENERARREAEEVAEINRHADELNALMKDVLEDQTSVFDT